jgi:hypothetical protein
MGLRSPQEMLRQTRLQPQPSVRFQGASAAQIDTQFLNTAQRVIQSKDEEQLRLAKANSDNEQEELRIKAQGELASAKGMDAAEKSASLERKLQDEYDKVLQKYPTRFLPELKAQSANNLNKFRSFQVPYVTSQVNEVKNKTYDVQLSNKMNFAIETSGDPDLFSQGALPEVVQALSEKATRQYGNAPQVVEYVVQKGVSETIRRSVEQQLRGGNLQGASSIAQLHNTKLIPSDRDKVNKLFKSAEEKEATRLPLDLATQIMKETGGDLVAAESMAREIAPDFQTYKKVRETIQTQFKLQKNEIERADMEVMADITEKLNTGRMPNPAEINSIQDFDTRTKFVNQINKNRGANAAVTDQTVYNSLLDKLSNATPEEAARVNLNAQKPFLGAEDYTRLERLKMDLSKKLADGRYRASQSDFRQVRSMVNQFSRGKSRSDQKKIMDLAMAEYERVRDANPNFTIADIRKSVTNRLFKEGVQTVEVPTWFGLSSKKVTKVAETLDPLGGKEVHSSWRLFLRNKFKDKLNEDLENKLLQELMNRHGEEAIKRPIVQK